MSYFITHDGTALVTDPEIGTVSAPSVSEALVEIQRRKSFTLHVLPGGRDGNRVYLVFSSRAVSPVALRDGKANGSGKTNHGKVVRKLGGACV